MLDKIIHFWDSFGLAQPLFQILKDKDHRYKTSLNVPLFDHFNRFRVICGRLLIRMFEVCLHLNLYQTLTKMALRWDDGGIKRVAIITYVDLIIIRGSIAVQQVSDGLFPLCLGSTAWMSPRLFHASIDYCDSSNR
jgi:hypothetical protein